MRARLARLDQALTRVGGVITRGVGTMWCAGAFTILACVSLPAAIRSGDPVVIVSWIAQTLLQLVLLSVIMVGQQIEADATRVLILETHDAALAEHEDTQQILREIHTMVGGRDG